MTTRRKFLGFCTAGASILPVPARGSARLRIGVMDTVLRMATRPEALAAAARLGFDGIQVTIGRPGPDGKLPLADEPLQARYIAESKARKIPIISTYLDVLHANCLKNDELAKHWVREGIDITRKLGARILMLVFFGKCELATREEMDAAARALKELSPEAERAGVILGFENTISAEDDLRVLKQVNSAALQVYYDIGNATNMGGFDVAREIRELGRKRICQFHFKDKGYLGEGKVDVPAALRAIGEIGFDGFAVLETSSPSKSIEDDLRRNLAYLRKLMA